MSRARAQQPAGLTLIEILVSMLVLAVGLTAMFTVLMGSQRMGAMAADRSAATQIVPQAIDEISRIHRHNGHVVETLNATGAVGAPDDQPTIHNLPSLQLNASGTTVDTLMAKLVALPCFRVNSGSGGALRKDELSMLIWPNLPGRFNAPAPYKFGGVKKQTNRVNLDVTEDFLESYRVLYRIERHPDWHPHIQDPNSGVITYSTENPASPHQGVYLLTLAVFRDASTTARQLEQVSDPVTVQLYDSGVVP